MQIAIGTYDHTKALKDGSVSAPGMSFDFVEVSPITRAFRSMAAEQAYDISEMALVTYMLARVYNKPIVGLPIVLVRSNLLPGLVTAEDSPITDPARAERQDAGHPLVHADQRRLGARHSAGRLRAGPRVAEVGDVRGRAPGRVHGPGQCHACARRTRTWPTWSRAASWPRRSACPLAEGLRSLVPDAAKAEAEWARSPACGRSTTS